MNSDNDNRPRIGGDIGKPPPPASRPASAPNPSPGSNSSNDCDCFIATAAYGTPLAEPIEALRQFRDRKLRYSAAGRRFIRLYYRWGPYGAAALRRHPAFKKPVRAVIAALIKLLQP